MTEPKTYKPETLKAAIENIDQMIPLLEKQIALYKEMKRGLEYKLKEASKA